jgi:hypothetical protein
MNGAFSRIALAALAASCLGCAMCQAPDDFAYSAYGGRVQREDMYHGRVGSILGPPAGYVVVPHEQQGPTPAAPAPAQEEGAPPAHEEGPSPLDALRGTIEGELGEGRET